MTSMAVLLALVALAPGGTQVNQTRPAARDARVSIENPSGSVRVVGWEREEVSVTGTLCPEAEGLDVSGSGAQVRIEVRTGLHVPHRCGSELEVRVPAASRVDVETFSAEIHAGKLTGQLKAESVSGGIEVAAGLSEAELETVSGAVRVEGVSRRTRAESVSGSVTVRGGREAVEAGTVSGRLEVGGGPYATARLETVSGELVADLDLTPTGTLDVESVSGSVDLVMPAGVSAAFRVDSFSGDIVNEASADQPTREEYGPGRSLDFSLGAGGARVGVETVSGRVRIAPRH